MPDFVARMPDLDLGRGFARRWNGGDAASSHLFSALSWMFPRGERFFIDVARELAATLPLSAQQATEIKVFVTQEAQHGRLHLQYNAVLAGQGFSDRVTPLLTRMIDRAYRRSPLSRLAIVCAYEHLTAVLGDFLLRRPQLLAEADPALALLWSWHAAEETEHKAVCFDLYRTAGGGYWRRCALYLPVIVNFSRMFARQYAGMLHEDGAWQAGQRWQTLRSTLRVLLGVNGAAWPLLRHGLAYLRPGFHPWQCANQHLLNGWLLQFQSRWRAVGTPAGGGRQQHE